MRYENGILYMSKCESLDFRRCLYYMYDSSYIFIKDEFENKWNDILPDKISCKAVEFKDKIIIDLYYDDVDNLGINKIEKTEIEE